MLCEKGKTIYKILIQQFLGWTCGRSKEYKVIIIILQSLKPPAVRSE